MHRYKLAVHILVILSVFNFVPVLAAPIPVQKARVREACADVADGRKDVLIASAKREVGQDSLTQASPSMSNYASGADQKTTNPIQLPSSASGGTELPWYRPGDIRRPSYAKGGTELPWYRPGDIRRPPYAKGGTELPWYRPGDIRRPSYAKGGTELPWYSRKIPPASSVRTKPNKWVATTKTEPASSSSGEMTPPPSSKVLPQSEQEGYRAQTPTEQPKPQSKSFWSNLASKSKSWFSLLNHPKL